MQEKTTSLEDAAGTICLSINAEKTKLLKINNKSDQLIDLNGIPIQETVEFSYLGSVFSIDGRAKEDIAARKKKAQVAFIHPRPIWKSRSLTAKNEN